MWERERESNESCCCHASASIRFPNTFSLGTTDATNSPSLCWILKITLSNVKPQGNDCTSIVQLIIVFTSYSYLFIVFFWLFSSYVSLVTDRHFKSIFQVFCTYAVRSVFLTFYMLTLYWTAKGFVFEYI